jgi:hypothetical protein
MDGIFHPPEPGPALTAIDLGREVQNADCPQCVTRGLLRVNPFLWDGKRHLHWLCQSCRHVWVEPDRRSADRPATF